MKHLKTFEVLMTELSHIALGDDAIFFSKLYGKIKDYCATTYPRYRIMGEYGKDMCIGALNKLLTFAKKKNDKVLIDLISVYLYELELFAKDPELHRSVRKYNL